MANMESAVPSMAVLQKKYFLEFALWDNQGLMVFSNYFINSIKKYCELLLERYEEKRGKNILITRVSGLIGFVVIAYLLFKQNH